MTALCGIYSPLNPQHATHELLKRMLRAVKHRGAGLLRQYVDEQAGLAMAAAFRPAEGARPEPPNWHEDVGRVTAMDGRIFNWRSPLGDDAHHDPTESAAVAALLRNNHAEFPEALDGGFALALWKKSCRELWLVRDALGRKPLYYSIFESGAILFASEPKAILVHRERAPTFSRDALSAYITFGCVPAPLTLFEGINKLFPGEALRVNPEGVVSKHDYGHIPRFSPGAASLEDLADPIRDSFLKTLEKHLRGTERVGVLLSGGADSTILLGALKLLGVPERHSLTLSHSERGLQVDNREDCNWARAVAALHGATHHVIDVDARPVASAREPALLRLFDDPLILENRVCGCELLLREAAGSRIGLCLSGNNQQAFGGIWEWKTLRDLLKQDSSRGMTTQRLTLEAHLNLFSLEEQSALLGTDEGEVVHVASSLLDGYLRRVDATDVFDAVASTSLLMRSPEQFIPFEERVAAASGVEICYPYFDPHLMVVANGIPARLRGRDSESMCLAALRRAFRDVLPDEVATREKVAYPRDPWTDAELPKAAEVFLSAEALGRSGVFEPTAVRRILAASKDRKNIGSRRQLWTLLFFQVWFDCYIGGEGVGRLEEAFSAS